MKHKLLMLILSTTFLATIVHAATDLWTGGGGGGNLFWLSTANWNPATIPQTGDQLVFTNTVSLNNSNNIPNGNFSGITFATPSGAFVLNGNSVTAANITDLQPATAETINLPLVAGSGNLNVNVTGNGVLNLNNVISGTGNLTNSGAGRVNLGGSNTFTGSLVINSGLVAVNQETNFPAAPVTATPGNIVINGGILQALAGFTMNSNHGIAVGPVSGSGPGTLSVNTEAATPNQYATLVYGGAIANNGGTGGLTKSGFGNLVLFGANTYTGATSNQVGTLTLDFSKPGAPANNIISSSSRLVFGGANAGAGVTNFAQLVATNSAAGTVSQTFNGTHVTIGNAIIRVFSGSGTANLGLGTLDHDAGGVLAITPPFLRGGSGNISTTSTNLNGIIGGWATISDGLQVSGGWNTSTNWAAIDGSSNIVNYTGFTVYSLGYVKDIMAFSNNLLIPSTVTGTLTNDLDNAGTTNDVNTITFDRTDAAWTFQIGTSNTLRLGTSGGLLKRTYGTSIAMNFGGGSGARLTAGGPNTDTPGDIVLTSFQTDNANNNFSFNCPIVDNGTGAVTVVKSGSGYAALSSANAHSGGTFIEGGRLRWNSSGCFGYGPVYIFPGGNTYANSTAVITNAFFLSGSGTQQEPSIGAIRYGPNPAFFTGPFTLIGDAEIGGQGGGGILGPISGPFKLTLCALSTVTGDTMLANTNNSWTGDTLITARNNTGVNSLTSSNSEVIPNGFGKGNVILQGFSSGIVRWNLNGFSETINGLSSLNALASGANCVITNGSPATLSTLTVGDNDQSGIFGGALVNGAGQMALTKIGGGVETLTNANNNYTGDTTINNGVLQLQGVGAIGSSANVNINGGTFDVSSYASYPIPSTQVININGGTFFIASASGSGSPANFTNGTLKVANVSVGQVTANLNVPTLNLGGSANVIQITGIPLISVYPQVFPMIKYTTLNGSPSTLSVTLPAGGFPPFTGFISNDTPTKTIYVVLTNGPVTPSLTWVGFSSGALNSTWDFVASDWTNIPAHTIASYADGSFAVFNDAGRTNVVNLTAAFVPAGIQVNNTNLNYTFTGTGSITGTNGISKIGPGKLVLDNTGADNYSGGLNIGSGGTVQIGKGDTGGSLGAPNNNVGNNGLLVFNRTDNLVVGNAISGTGSLLVSNAFGTTLALNGANSFDGNINVIVSNIVKAGSATALGSTNGSTTIANGAALDINGQSLSEAVTIAGPGVLNLDGSTNGALYNSSVTASTIGSVTLTADSVVGASPDAATGDHRLDVRGAGAALGTGGNAYKLTKVSANQLSLIGVAVDAALGDVNVANGILDVEGGTTGLGNTNANLSLANGTILQIFSLTNKLSKQIQVASTTSETATITTGVTNNGTTSSAIGGSLVLNGNATLNTLNGSFNVSSAISGAGGLTKNGNGSLTVSGADGHSGGIIINGGTVVFNSTNNSTAGSSEITLNPSASPVPVILGGNGIFKGPADIEDTLWPGVAGKPSTLKIGNGVDYSVPGTGDPGFGALVLGLGGNSPNAIFSLNTATTVGGGVNDLVNVTGGLNANNAKVYINPLTPLNNGSTYTLLTYTSGSEFSGFGQVFISTNLVADPNRYKFTLSDSSGVVSLTVNVGAGQLVWTNTAANGVWDVTNTFNWFNTGGVTNDYFAQLDVVLFDDSAPAGSTNITLSAVSAGLRPALVTVNTTNYTYSFAGSGKISGNANIIKKGPSKLTVSTANDFTGTTLISDGALVVNNTNALGALTAVTVVTNTGTLDIGGASFSANQGPLLGSRPIFVSGWGVNSNGVVVNNSANSQNNAFASLTLTADAALGGVSRWDIGRPSVGNGSLSTGGKPYNLYKVGTNFIAFLGLNVDTNLANIEIRAGALGFQQGTLSLGNPASNLVVQAGGSLEFFNDTAAVHNFTKQFILIGDGVATTLNNERGTTTLNGSMVISNNCLVGGAGTTTTNNCVVSGSGGITKVGLSSLVLAAGGTYTGNTIVGAGSLVLPGSASIDISTNVTVLAGATLDVTGRTNGTFTVNANRTFSGNGTIAGNLSNASGGLVSVGTNGAVGILAVSAGAYLNGATYVDLNASANTNDVLRVTGNLVLGGTLNVSNIAGTLAGGQSYKLFNAATYTTNYSAIVPSTPGANMIWDASGLGVDGTLKIVSTGPPPVPQFSSITITGTTLGLTVTNGALGGAWTLLQSTNVAIPLAQWETNRTGVFDGVGSVSTNIAGVVTNKNQMFYSIKY